MCHLCSKFLAWIQKHWCPLTWMPKNSNKYFMPFQQDSKEVFFRIEYQSINIARKLVISQANLWRTNRNIIIVHVIPSDAEWLYRILGQNSSELFVAGYCFYIIITYTCNKPPKFDALIFLLFWTFCTCYVLGYEIDA